MFRVNRKEPRGGTGFTQFSRAFSSLHIEILCAHAPAAKGRVEREACYPRAVEGTP